MDLLALSRKHDLPPRWDGYAVVWQGWEYAPSGVFICPPPQVELCEGCNEPTTERGFPCWSTNKGLKAESFILQHADYAAEEAARARLPEAIQHKAPCHWWVTFTAFRCHHCNLDTVWDMTTHEMWTLDHADYGDEGSR